MVSYEQSIDKENEKLNEIEKKYLCYICGDKHTCALNTDGFYIDIKKNKIVCENCAGENNIETKNVFW